MTKLSIKYYQHRIEKLLDKTFPIDKNNDKLIKVMRYSLLNGGKRLRPLLAYAAGCAINAPLKKLDHAAIAVECIHTYSLIHDDLPSMDNDDYRRGKLTCHKKFNEALAILAGDALQSFAFEILTKNEDIFQLQLLSKAIGQSGMALGQALDIAFQQNKSQKISHQKLFRIHHLKTAELINVSILLGFLCGKNNDKKLFQLLNHFGKTFGLAFQLRDDVLDKENQIKKNMVEKYIHKTEMILKKIQQLYPAYNFELLQKIREYILCL